MKALPLRTFARSSLLLTMALAGFGAHAELKLFPTDTLSGGEADVSFDLSRVEIKQDDAPRFKNTTDAATLSARLGYGARTHFEFSIARADAEQTADGWARASANATIGGIGIRHALEMDGPVSVAFDGGITHVKGPGQAQNLYSAGVSAGLKLASSAIRPYLTAGVTVPDESDEGLTWGLEAGAWIPVAASVTLIPSVQMAKTNGTLHNESSDQVGLELAALVKLNERVYLHPALGYATGSIGDEDGKATSASLAVFYKF